MDARVLPTLLTTSPTAATSLRSWWDASAAARGAFSHTIERALVGGALADRLGFAFAAGYAEALRTLVPALDNITALCATEEAGNHPRAIRTALTEVAPGRYSLAGHKKWATVASEASTLLVVATLGIDPVTDRPRLRVVRVPTTARNLRITSTSAPFIPEIEHAEIELAGVEVTAADILPGDGYDDYLKPFRTVEDLHVHAALIGYLTSVARRHAFPAPLVESLLALAATTCALADADTKSPVTHLALAGLLDLATNAVTEAERAWSSPRSVSSSASDSEWQRWQRDRPLLQVATKARLARRETARRSLLA